MAKSANKATALWVLKRLRREGFAALFAGGCVRDMLLGRRPADYDIATDATPDQVKELFRRALLVGAQFGVAVVVHNRRHVEVATFRDDVSYSDGRRPDAVRFSTPRGDALRRDFTINGMFYDPVGEEVIDYVGGRADLAAGMIRTIGRPDDRFREDYLRLIRAARFAARFGFEIEPATAAGVRKHAGRIASVSGERIFDELSKMLSLETAGEALATCRSLGLAEAIAPELFQEAGTWQRAVDRVGAVAGGGDAVLGFGGLLAELAPATIRRVLGRWGASNALRDAVCFLAAHLGAWPAAADRPLREFKRLLAVEHFGRLRKLWRHEEQRATGGTRQSRRIARRANAIPKDLVCPPPLVGGADLLSMGLAEGPQMGRILRALYDAQLDEELTTRGEALARARERIEGAHR